MELLALLAMGMAGSLHCAAMCGGLALLVSGGKRPGAGLAFYLAGKTWTYVMLGAAAGALGRGILDAAPVEMAGRSLAILGAAGLIVAVLQSVGWAPEIRLGRHAGAVLAALSRERSGPGRLLLGAANGLLPCPMVLAFAALAAASGSPLRGSLVMAILGLTSAVPLAVTALAGRRIAAWAGQPARAAGILLMLGMAALLTYRGLAPGLCH